MMNTFKTAVRSLKKRVQYSFINILGLSIAISSSLFILLYIEDELSFDTMFEESEQVHKLILERKFPDRTTIMATVPHSMVSAIGKDLPEIEAATAMCGPFDEPISFKRQDSVNVSLLESNVYAADSNFLKIFSFKMLSGNRETALSEPRMMVLTESVAKKYFGNEEAFGRSVFVGRDHFIVTGVCQDPPLNSHFNFTILTSIHTIERFNLLNYSNPDVHCYFKTNSVTEVPDMEKNVGRLVEKYARPEVEELNKTSWESFVAAGNAYYYKVKPLSDVHLDPNNISGMRASGSFTTLKVLAVIGILILVIAFVNFVNLTTVLSIQRSKEVIVRKILGSRRSGLVYQFLNESFLLAVMSTAIGVVMLYLALPYLNALVDKQLYVTGRVSFVVCVVAVVVCITMLGGYPAFALSSFKISDFRVSLSKSATGEWLRNALVTFQFWISITLAIALLVMMEQINYIRHMDIGFSKEHLLMVRGDFFRDPRLTQVLLQEFERDPNIESTSGSLSMPTLKGIYDRSFKTDENNDVKVMSVMYLADKYDKVMDLKLVSGNFFSNGVNDSLSVVLNEAAVDLLGIKDPVGKTLTYIEQTYGTGEETKFKIIGVVKNFNFQTVHNEIRPLVLHSTEINYNRMSYILCKIQPNKYSEAIDAINRKWKELHPDAWFQYRFLDEALDSHYKKEQAQVKIIMLFGAVSLFISCIGLFGLSAFSANARLKEIGIRKAIGATSVDIMIMLLASITKKVVLGFVISVPVAAYLVNNFWLDNFAYRVGLDVLTITVVGLGAIIIAWLTVAYQTYNASIKNPVEVLRTE